MPKTVLYSDNYQRKYRYQLTAPAGKKFDPEFKPGLTPKEMLKAGVFGGAYFDGVDGLIPSDLPKSWFQGVRLSPDGKKQGVLNYFRVNASQPLSAWREKGWIYPDDPHGWFQWYCRYYLGRRLPDQDRHQIKRWKAMRRHIVQIGTHCKAGDLDCRRKQRQAVLHWGYESRKM